MINLKEGIVVCSKDIKEFLIHSIEKEKSFFDVSYMTLDSLKKRLFFDYKKRAIYEVSKKFKVNVQIAKTYLDNLMYLDNSKDNIEKVLFLKGIKKFIKDSDLEVLDYNFINHLKNKTINFVGYEVTKELKNIITFLKKVANVNVLDIFKNNNKDIKVYELSDINQEVNYVFEKINKLVSQGISLNKIKLANVSKDYNFIVNRVARSYDFIVSDNTPGSLLNSDKMNLILEELLKYDNFKQALEEIKLSDILLNKIVNIVNSYEGYDISPKDFYHILEYELSNINFDDNIYEQSLETIRLEESYYTDDYYIFYLGFNNESVTVFKDQDYLEDKVKKMLNINTSLEKNMELRNAFIKRLNYYENIVLTFTKNLIFKEVLKSNLIGDLNIKIIEVDDNVYLNKRETNLFLGQLLDNYYTFNDDNVLLRNYAYDDFLYHTYDNKFKGLDKEVYNVFQEEVIRLSYSSLNEYEECSFKYFVSRILKIDSFEDSLATKLGTFAHDLLKDSYNKAFCFEESKQKGMLQALTSKEVFFFNQVADIIKEVVSFNKLYESRSELQEVMCEQKVSIDYDNEKLLFEGIIDKLIYQEIEGKTLVAIIDYKTSAPSVTLSKLNLQLLVYLYLITKGKMFDNPQVVGMYLQKIGPIKYKNSNKTSKEQLIDHLKLEGYSIKDTTYLSLLNRSFDDGYLKSMKLKKDGSFYSYAKVIEKDRLNSLVEQTENKVLEAYEKIKRANFDINPKKSKLDDSCKFCKFNDVCFKTFRDYVLLEEIISTEEVGDKIVD